MKTSSSGSAVLIVLILMGVLTMLLLTLMQETTFLRLFVSKQILAEQNASLGHGLLAYGIAQAKKNYKELTAKENEAELELLLENTIGRIILTGNKQGIVIQTWLFQEESQLFSGSCRLSQNSDKKFIIQGFQR